MNRIIAILLASFLFVNISNAQKLDYEDIYASLKTSKDFEVYQVLLDYQKANPFFANTYYQLGIICQKWMRQYDPFLQSNDVRENIRNAQLFFSLSFSYCDESDARKNKEYYQGIKPETGKEFPGFKEIQQDIKNRMQDVETFKKYFNKDISSLVNCVTKYNLCISTFNEINQQNSRLKDLYFLTGSTLTAKLSNLKTNFDSAIYYFNRLSTSLKEFPLGNYNPDFTLTPVLVYRLHGLTSSNFLNNNVSLWDFGSWVNAFNKILETDIAELNKRAIETDNIHSGYSNKLKQKDTEGIPPDYKMDPALLNKIYKYDFKSALARLFEYQEMKINYLEHFANCPKIVIDSLNLRITVNKPDYYFQLVEYKHITDSLLNNLRSDATEAAINKYSNFFKDHYNGYKGIIQYMDNQTLDNDFILKSSLEDYKNNMMSELKTDTIAKTLKFKKIIINVNITRPDQIKAEGYYTFFKTETPGREVIISGSCFAKNSDVSAFVAVIDTLNNIKWLRTYKPGQAMQYGLIAKPINDGVIMATVSKTQRSQSVTMLTFDNEGNVKTTKEIKTPSIPRKIVYDDINQTTLLACKGNVFDPFSMADDSLGVYLIDADLSVLWIKKFGFNGNLSDVLKINNQFLLFGAFNRLTSPDGRDITLGSGISNVFLSILDAEGNSVQTITYPSEVSYYPLKVAKINSDFIDIISIKETKPGEALLNENKTAPPYYLITTTKGDGYFSY
jgi:hypothetical protein